MLCKRSRKPSTSLSWLAPGSVSRAASPTSDPKMASMLWQTTWDWICPMQSRSSTWTSSDPTPCHSSALLRRSSKVAPILLINCSSLPMAPSTMCEDRSFTPSPTHRFLRRLHDQNQLLRVYSQNVDGLEAAAGVTNVIQCHGTLATSSCMSCDYTVDTSAALQSCQRDGVIPRCPHCIHGILKPNITFFGETLQDATRHALPLDRNKADLVLVMGTSLQVSPVADIPVYLNAVPQILVNMQSVRPRRSLAHRGFDVECLGPSDAIVEYLITAMDGRVSPSPTHMHAPNRHCFEGCHVLDDVPTAEHPQSPPDAFHCDECNQPIVDARFSCTSCFDFDLCSTCRKSTSHPHAMRPATSE
ncbi:hypothetical protein, variant 10 [Aphanomyces invadans]|uniref:Deacetylase sirtuin-type domain-containing protein n=1 Tax=Aphanomyces invadans TaxID=157072 RepID=A0A024TES9_9STRA|nr:hypothetical protein, variant 9 [Aphanomyces invadans]XP_008878846.1 hypothetical protein, variant 10 [Aphanomyces invadans]ETV92542.1 hypothetical protein, variant 9 [Aphanomyces invadans]ETV92543.1 hypothetical protein, variant 10 [Aphanomyces invadans]|eukprot:XP_008878845.1 hypothetical protein, variant 9 [Aphanomyces invadans]